MKQEIIVRFLWLLSVASDVNGYATRLITNAYCGSQLNVGASFMSGVVLDNSRTFQVLRSNVPLTNGASYIPGETLSLTFTPPGGGYQWVFDVKSGDGILSGSNIGCSNKRSVNIQTVQLTLPTSGDVKIQLASANQALGVISLTSEFTLFSPFVPGAPTYAPASPTAAPTIDGM